MSQKIFLCAIALVIAASSPVSSQSSPPPPETEICYNAWIGQPDPMEICSIFQTSSTLQLTCRVSKTVDQNASVQWYFSETRDNAGTNGSLVVGFSQSSSDKVSAAFLTVSNSSQRGYYWCEITVPSSVGFRNPSRVLYIAETCATPKCEGTMNITVSQTSNDRCAIGGKEEELTVVDFYDRDVCMNATSSEKNKTTTEAIKAPESPNSMKPTSEPSNPSEEDKTNGTIRNGKPTDEMMTTQLINDMETTESDGGGAGSNTAQVKIWLGVGVGIGVLLIIVVVLLTMIICLQCAKRRIKDSDGPVMPSHLFNQAYMTTELELPERGLSHASSVGDHKPQEADTGNHTYAEITAPNFTLAASSDEHSPGLQTTQQNHTSLLSSLPGQYEDVDLEPDIIGTDPKNPIRKHQYEAVTNEEDDDYHRLLRSESSPKSRKLSTSVNMTALASPTILSSREDSTPFPLPRKDSDLFDNPKYSQLDKKHTDIYRSVSSDSTSGGSQSQFQQEVHDSKSTINDDIKDYSKLNGEEESSRAPRRTSKGGETHRDKGDYFQDSSVFVVTGLAKDESKLSSGEDMLPESTHYMPIIEPEGETTYTLPIVSNHEKYISERGHLYQVLEEAPKNNSKMSKSLTTDGEFVSEKGHVYQVLENIAENVKESKKEEEGPTSEEEGSKESQKMSALPYSVVVKVEKNDDFEAELEGTLYHVLDRSMNCKHDDGNSVSSRNAVSSSSIGERRISESKMTNHRSPQTNGSGYDVMERSVNGSRASQPPVMPANSFDYDVITRNITTSQTFTLVDRGRSTSSASPPTYSSLEVSGEIQKYPSNGSVSFYQTLDQASMDDRNMCQCESSGTFYHTLEPEGAEGRMRNEDTDDIYHTIQEPHS